MRENIRHREVYSQAAIAKFPDSRLIKEIRDGKIIFKEVPEHRLVNPKVAEALVRSKWVNFRSMPGNLRTAELSLVAIGIRGDSLRHVPEKSRTKKVLEAACRNCDYEHWFILREIEEDRLTKRMCQLAVGSKLLNIRDVPQKFIDEYMVKLVLSKDARFVVYLPESLITVEEAMTAVKSTPEIAWDILPEELVLSQEFLRKLMEEAPESFDNFFEDKAEYMRFCFNRDLDPDKSRSRWYFQNPHSSISRKRKVVI